MEAIPRHPARGQVSGDEPASLPASFHPASCPAHLEDRGTAPERGGAQRSPLNLPGAVPPACSPPATPPPPQLTGPLANSPTRGSRECPAFWMLHCLKKNAGLMKIKCLGMDCSILQNVLMHQQIISVLLGAGMPPVQPHGNPQTPTPRLRPHTGQT